MYTDPTKLSRWPAAVVSAHAVARYQERVDPSTSVQQARIAVTQIVMMGRCTPRPRRWMRGRALAPGTRCVYWAQQPGVGLIVVNDVVVTVVTRALCKQSPRRPQPKLTGRPHEPAPRWRWTGDCDVMA